METESVITLSGVSKMYKLFPAKIDRLKESLHPFGKKFHKEFYALSEISLSIQRGEILGIVGMNGSGKSTLLKMIAGIIQPTLGRINVSGNVVPLLELGAGFNPEFSGLENIYFYNSILGYTRRQTDVILAKILDFAEIGDFIHQPLKTYSSGMKARLSFAVSVNIDPDILIVDEVLSVGDELFRRKSFARLEEFFKAGKTVLFVSHNEGSINQLCTRAIMLNRGRIVLDGPPKLVTMNYSKFVFSKPHEQENLLKQFLTAGHDATRLESIEPSTPVQKNDGFVVKIEEQTTVKPFYIPNFLPKSTVVTLNGKIRVENFRIETKQGQIVNSLVPHRHYYFFYTVKVDEELGNVNIGIGFRTEKGVPLSWRVVPDKNRFFDRVFRPGDEYQVKWEFYCLFMPGTYFINTSVRKNVNQMEQIVFRGQDIHVFRVQGGDRKDSGGLFDAQIGLEVIPIIK